MGKRPREVVLILDFGSQYTQLITRTIRELGVYSEIKPFNISISEIEKIAPKGIILSGGPSSVYEKSAPLPDKNIFGLKIPILGICYGLQVLAYFLGGRVKGSQHREYGLAELQIDRQERILKNFSSQSSVWMSHTDTLTEPPQNFDVLAHTENSPFAVIADFDKKFYGVQFHPEVAHTKQGKKLLQNFLFEVCDCQGEWSPGSFVKTTVDSIRQTVGSANAICALSGGVDSAVAATLVSEAIGDQLTCIFVDTGLLRKNEANEVEDTFRHFLQYNFVAVDASEQFLKKLKGVTDPETKRKIIGETFIEVFEKEAQKIPGAEFLIQGTLYPDVIESVSTKGPSVTIKTHHNVGGLPERMLLKLMEPLRELFKDEVRKVGKELGMPPKILARHPFPGPGLAVRVLGEVTKERLVILREADDIFIEELRKNDLYDHIWQAFAVLIPVKTVGVMGDQRTYENLVGIRAVTSVDGMTADWARIPQEILAVISNRIINKVRGVNRVVYDISSKPPSTIEWE